MNSNKLITLIAVSAALTLFNTGCRHTPTNNRPIPGQTGPNNPGTLPLDTVPPGQTMPQNNPTGIPNNQTIPLSTMDHSSWVAHPDVLQGDTIHFDYDKSAIRAGEESKLSAVIDYLKSTPNCAVRVEGNCDERGTEEYNRALGERRALAARERIAQAGIDPNRVDIVTYGKDKPVDTGNSDAAHAHNRRDDFVVLTPPGQ